MDIKLSNCRIVSQLADGITREYADIYIGDGLIQSITAAGNRRPAKFTIDCQGQTLLPGLFDLHMHMNWSYLKGEIRLDDFKILTQSCLSAKRYLDNGFTTIRDMGSPRRVAAAVRTAIDQELILGPRILCAGLILNPVNRVCAPEEYIFLRQVSGCDEMLRAAREEIGSGADYIKLYMQNESLLPEEIETAVRIARIHGKKVAAHAHDQIAIELCLDIGIDTIEHGSYVDEGSIERFKKEDSYLVPTLAVLNTEIASPGFTVEQKRRALAPLLEANATNITRAYKAGLKLGFGTDMPIECMENYTGLEFKMRKEYCSMDNIDMLLQATKYSAEIVGLGGLTGEIKEGLVADLIAVRGNPDEDISAMYNKPEIVIARGKCVKHQ